MTSAYFLISVVTILLDIEKVFAEKYPIKKSKELCPVECLCGMGTSQYLSGYFTTVDCRNKKLLQLPLIFPPDTVVLLLRGNALEGFRPVEQFTSLAALRDLDISYNRLRNVNLTSLNHSRLAYLNLKSNNIETLSTSANFWSVSDLEILQLSDNRISMIEAGTFEGLVNLQRLTIAGNRLKRLTRDIFSGLSSLRELRIDRCLVEQIEDATFRSLIQLETLTLTYNEISELSRNSFVGLERLQHLHLEGNKFQTIPGDSFGNFQNLKSLTLNYNPVRKLTRLGFNSLSIQEINLEYMSQLQIVDREAFYNLRTLSVINIANNPQLSFIDKEAFILCTKLTSARIFNNSISAFPRSLLNISTELKSLDLRRNPIRCDCNSEWIADYLNSNSTRPEILVTNSESFCDQHDSIPLQVIDTRISIPGSGANYYKDINQENDFQFNPNDIIPDRLDNVTDENPVNNSVIVPYSGSCAPVAIRFFNDTIYQELGKSIVMDCRAIAVPDPKLYWITSNGKVIRDSPNDSRLKLDKRGTLSIQYVKQADAGRYSCVAINERGSDEAMTVLRVFSPSARVICQSIGSNFISISWSGTDSTIASVQYAILYREGNSNSTGLPLSTPYNTAASDYGIIELRRYMRNYWIGNLKSRTLYEICMTYETNDRRFVRIDCSHVQTGDPDIRTEVDGIYKIASRVVLSAILLTCAAPIFICVLVVFIRRYHRRKCYAEPRDRRRLSSVLGEVTGEDGGTPGITGVTIRPLSHIPLDDLFQLPSTPLATSRTSLIS